MYDKVVLNALTASKLHKESIQIAGGDRIVFRQARHFREYLGISASQEGTVVSKGNQVRVNLNFPGWVPQRDPLENWFQIALKASNPMLADPLNCEARYKGVLPGFLRKGQNGSTEFFLEAEPRYAAPDYALFIYDSADYKDFLEGVRKLLQGFLSDDHGVGGSGNKILVSDNSAHQPMLLIPTSLLIGGEEYVVTTWEKLLEGR